VLIVHADDRGDTVRTVDLPTPVTPPRAAPTVGVNAIEDALRRRVDGEIRFDAGSRAAYSTDASNYRQVPIGVVVPRSPEASVEAVAVAREHRAPLLPRGGGTSLEHAVMGSDADHELLRRAGVDAQNLESGCCGLAGNFGFERGHLDVSAACAERVLLPSVREADHDSVVLADGFSCRPQIHELDSGGHEGVHLAEVLAAALRREGVQPGVPPEKSYADRPAAPGPTARALTGAGAGLAALGTIIGAGIVGSRLRR
jgi:hypothetical protein